MLARPAALLTTFAVGVAAGAVGLAVATRAPRPADCPAVPPVAAVGGALGDVFLAPATDDTSVAVGAEAAARSAEAAARTAQEDAEARIAQAEQAQAEARRAVRREAEARTAAERRRAQETLRGTALHLAGHVQAWTLKPVAFGGGAGSLAGLGFEDLARPTDAQGRYPTVDGLFTLTVSGDRATIRGAHRQFSDLTTTAVVQVTSDGTRLVVDGRDYGGAQVR